MKKRNLGVLIAAASAVAVLTVGTVFASNIHKSSITCPNCGTEIEMQKPQLDGQRGPMSIDALKANLEEKVANGEISQEQADAQLAKCQERQADMEERKAQMQASLDEKVASGELSQEQADQMLNGEKGKHGGRMHGGHHNAPAKADGSEITE